MALRRQWPFLFLLLALFASALQAEPRVRFLRTLNSFSLAPGAKFDLDLRSLLADLGSGNFVWSIPQNKPAWLTLDAANHRLSGTPDLSNVGTSRFTLFVQDGEKGDSTQMEFRISAAPIWSRVDIDLGIQIEDSFWQFDLRGWVSNPAGGSLSFTAKGLPEWMSISSDGILSGTPRRAHVGAYRGIEITASGAGGSSSASARGLVIETGAALQLSGPQSFPIESCKKFSVSLVPASPVLSPLTVLLREETLGVQFFANALCQPSIDRIQIPAGASSVDLYVRSGVQGQTLLKASANPFLPANLSVTFTAKPVPKIILTATDRQPEVGGCLRVSAELQDEAGNLWDAPQDALLALSASRPDVKFFLENSCANEITNLSVPAGEHGTFFYVSATQAEEKTLFAASPGYTSATLSLTYRAGQPFKLVLTPDKSIVKVNECTPARIQLYDRYNNVSAAIIDVTALLSSQGPAAAFYADSNCTNLIQSAAIPAAATSAVLGFSAKAAGELTLVVSSSQGLEGSSAPVTVVKPATFVWLEGGNLDFGKVEVGTWKDATVTLKNTGGAGTLLTVGTLPAPFSVLAGTTCQANLPLAENETCVVKLRFQPTAAGAQTASLAVGSDYGTLQLALTGTGTLPPKFRFAGGADLDFGEVWVNQRKDLSLTIENQGGEGSLSSITTSGAYFSILESSTCRSGAVLATNAKCALAIRFAPASAGTFTGKIAIVSSGGTLEGNLRGIGKLMPQIGWIGNGLLDFGDLLAGTAKDLPLTVVNRGGDGVLGNLSTSGTGFSVLPQSTCRSGQVLAAGASCLIYVRFSPAVAGTYTGALSLSHPTGTATAELRGRALNPGQLVMQPSSLAFSPILVGNKANACVSVTNVGGAAVVLNDLSLVLGTDFSLINAAGCGPVNCSVGQTLTSQASCALRVQFNPSRVASFGDTVRVGGTTFGIALDYGIALSGQAVARPEPPRLNIYANGIVNYLKFPSNQPVTISWASSGATDCKVSQNDFAARYQYRAEGAWTAGPWSGPDWLGLGHPGVVVAANSDAALRDVTYTLTCQGPGGTATAAVRVQRYSFGAGGPVQIGYVLSTQEEAIACHKKIKSAANVDPECGKGTWGTFWSDGTTSPWWVKPGTQPGGGKWCTCFNPKTAPDGKPWAKRFGTP